MWISTRTLYSTQLTFSPAGSLYPATSAPPIVLAENEYGEFSLEDLDYGAGTWLECMAQDLREVKKSPDWRLPDAENGLYVEDFWNALTPVATKSNEAYYDIYSSYTERVIDLEVAHLTSTKWHQGSPYNEYCPLKSNSDSERVPAGCVAVAGAQMLYYLHTKIGLPTEAPTDGSCEGNVHNYSQSFSGLSTVAWNYMNDRNYDYASLLIGWTGQNVYMSYGNDGSGAWNASLASFINALGIFCQNRTYDSELASSSLLDSLPVIMGAYGNLYTLDIPDLRDGHTFIIDGYRSFKNRIYRTYVKYNPVECLDTLDAGCIVFEPDLNDYYITVSESSPWVEQIRMNWGWGNNNDNTWYSTTDRWITTHTGQNGMVETEDFYYNRRMIYDFQAL